MQKTFILLIHPPVAKPSEPPAGVACLAGALRFHKVGCQVIDANYEGLLDLVFRQEAPQDTWSRRVPRHLESHLAALRSTDTFRHPDSYRRAVSDINRLLDRVWHNNGVRIGLANYVDEQLNPGRSSDLVRFAEKPKRNPFYHYYQSCNLYDTLNADKQGCSKTV